MLYTAKKVARQLCMMQQMQVVQPSKSLWASPVVLVQKKDAKADNYPLPHTDNLMDELGKAKFFSTLDDLANTCPSRFTGKDSIFDPLKFRVMPFGLKNVPRIFQRLMQQVCWVLIR